MARLAKNIETVVPALRRYARALTADPEIADDLVRETLLRMLRSKHLLHGSQPRSRLYAILTNLNRSRLRTIARQPIFTEREVEAAADLQHIAGSGIEHALGALVENQREALLLVVLEGLTYREVADVQSVPIATVASRVARARNEIKDFLETLTHLAAAGMTQEKWCAGSSEARSNYSDGFAPSRH